MLVLTSIVLLFAVGFLFGLLIIAAIVTTKHRDPSASYKLYAVRDKLIGTVVFNEVSRDDPWLDALYENVNSVLVHSRLLSGPDKWPIAVEVGKYQAKFPKSGKSLRSLPESTDCPEPVAELSDDLRDALNHLLQNHMGILLQLDARKREERRIQKEKAKKLLNMMGPGAGCHAST